MGRERGEDSSLDLFSTNTGRDDPSPPPPKPPDTDKTTGGDSRRYVLPNNLHDAVKYLNDEELDSLRVATLEETKRRDRLPPSVGPDSAQSPLAKRMPRTDKISQRRRVDVAEVSLTRGQVNAVRSAFKAGINQQESHDSSGFPNRMCGRRWQVMTRSGECVLGNGAKCSRPKGRRNPVLISAVLRRKIVA
jgi:hypothetical protein